MNNADLKKDRGELRWSFHGISHFRVKEKVPWDHSL